MLSALHIENVAVIERTDIDFLPGLNVLTGETGAGKSIIIDSIDAVLGGRTSRELVRTGADKALVRAVFDAAGTESWCEENDVDASDGELILQRRITSDGKSACRVNGMPVSVSQLHALGALLLDIHGQNDGRQLMDEHRHLGYLDAFGEVDDEYADFRAAYDDYKTAQKEIDRLSMDEAEKERLTERLRAEIEELEKADLHPGEEAALTERRDLMKNSGKLTESLDESFNALYGGSPSALELLGDAQGWLTRAAGYSENMQKALDTVKEARLLLEDASELVRDFRGELDFSPEEYDRLESRLALLRKLSRRYGLDEESLIARLEENRARLDEIEYADDRLLKLQKELDKRRETALNKAKRLSAARAKAAETLQKRIENELRELSMPSVRFLVEMKPVDSESGFDSTGCDRVRFLMSANAGETPGPISRIASGGELSRIMLAMKCVFAERDTVPSLVFDEIDTGVSGIAAQRVAEKLADVSRHKQVLCITHLPQIAAMADSHFEIRKSVEAGRTFTNVEQLDMEGRAGELARLHGGDHVTEATLVSAREQLGSAARYKAEAANR